MNYFNYFTEIEDTFIRRRGKHLLLSSMDWALIQTWKDIGVPLHVALRGIEKSFDSWDSKPRKRTVKSLLYCQEEVEAQYSEWQEAHVGASDEQSENGSAASPFSRDAIQAHLARGRSELQAALQRHPPTTNQDLSEAITRAIQLLEQIESEAVETGAGNAQKLEQSLTGVERLLTDAARNSVEPRDLEALEVEVKDQLKPYRKQMQAEVYQQTFDNLLMKRLREKFFIPRLSLFYL